MKNTFLKVTGRAALAVLMLTLVAQIPLSAQDITKDKGDEQTEEDLSTRRENTRKLEGAWNVESTARNCQTGVAISTTPQMLTFMRGGTMYDSGTRNSPSLRSPSHGVWSYESSREYTSAFQFFRFNADGTFAGRQVVRQQIELSQSGSSFTATSTAQVFDVNGNVIANNCSTGIGTRFE